MASLSRRLLFNQSFLTLNRIFATPVMRSQFYGSAANEVLNSGSSRRRPVNRNAAESLATGSAEEVWEAAATKRFGGDSFDVSGDGGRTATEPGDGGRAAAGPPPAGFQQQQHKQNQQSRTQRPQWVVNEVMNIGRHTKVTKGGRIFSFSALVLLGNGRGTAGYGYGKALTANQAILRANADAERNLISVPLYDGRTVPDAFSVKQDGVRVQVIPLPRGSGVRAGSTNEMLCRAFGLTDVVVKSHGRRNMKSWVRAFVSGMYHNSRPSHFKSEALGKRGDLVQKGH